LSARLLRCGSVACSLSRWTVETKTESELLNIVTSPTYVPATSCCAAHTPHHRPSARACVFWSACLRLGACVRMRAWVCVRARASSSPSSIREPECRGESGRFWRIIHFTLVTSFCRTQNRDTRLHSGSPKQCAQHSARACARARAAEKHSGERNRKARAFDLLLRRVGGTLSWCCRFPTKGTSADRSPSWRNIAWALLSWKIAELKRTHRVWETVTARRATSAHTAAAVAETTLADRPQCLSTRR
jgi:hypothetical protein